MLPHYALLPPQHCDGLPGGRDQVGAGVRSFGGLGVSALEGYLKAWGRMACIGGCGRDG